VVLVRWRLAAPADVAHNPGVDVDIDKLIALLASRLGAIVQASRSGLQTGCCGSPLTMAGSLASSRIAPSGIGTYVRDNLSDEG
jgi:hypothetical protein